MAIKTFNDGSRFVLSIEPVGSEEQEMITEIKKICKLTSDSSAVQSSIPSIPVVQKEEKKNSGSKIIASLENYIVFYNKYKTGQYNSPEEKEEMKAKVFKTADYLKTHEFKGEELRFCIEHLSELFSPKIEQRVLDEMKLSKEQLLASFDEKILSDAYKIAIS